jgi:hypothetical protein
MVLSAFLENGHSAHASVLCQFPHERAVDGRLVCGGHVIRVVASVPSEPFVQQLLSEGDLVRTPFRDHVGCVLPLAGAQVFATELARLSEQRDLTNRWSQPLAAVLSRFDIMKEFPMFAMLALASGGSARTR